MKKIISFLLMALFLMACHTTKKITETSQQAEKKEVFKQVETVKTDAKVNNDLTVEQETTTVTEEYYPPEPDKPGEAPAEPGETTKPEPKKGALKSRTVSTTKAKTADKGTTAIKEDKETNTDIATDDKTATTNKAETERKLPIRWGWIFGILIILAGAGYFIYRKRGSIKLIFNRIFG